MNPNQYEEAVRVFHEARAQADPITFVEELNISDTTICACVLMMLKHDSQTLPRDFSHDISQHVPFPDPPFSARGFKVLRRLGEGGMGVVYEAHDIQLDRTVALKVLKHTALAHLHEDRLLREAQILAKLRNPHIATVYGIGTFPSQTGSEHPFISMEYVDGVSITDYIHQHQLSLQKRLTLFASVCRAVEDAHAHRILHRDLSPNNILISSAGVPKVIDFGIASLFDPASGTSDEQLYGTPPYMSPEALRGDTVTTKADVYALGVLLHQILVQQAPDDHSWLERTPKGDLGCVSAKARATEPENRYRSADSLADDIERYIRCLPIDARPRTPTYVARRFVQRHPWLMAGSFTLLLVASVAAINESRLRQVAENALEAAQRQTAIAKEVNAFLNNDLLGAAHPSIAQGETITVRQVLDRAASLIPNRFTDKPLVEAGIQSTIGRAYLALGCYDPALAHISRALELRQQNLGPQHVDTIDSLNDRAVVLNEIGKYDEAIAILKEARHVQETQGRAKQALTLDVIENLAYSYRMLSRFEDAETLYQLVIATREETENPDDPELLETLSKMAALRFQQGRYDDARHFGERVLDSRRRTLGERHPDTLHALNNLAGIYSGLGQLDRAEAVYRELSTRYEEILGPDHADTVLCANNLAVVLRSMKKFEDAEVIFRKCLQSYKGSLGDNDPRTIGCTANLAATLQDLQRFEQAEALFSDAITKARIVLGDRHWYIGAFQLARGQCLVATTKFEDAKRALEEAHDILLESLGAEHERTLAAARSLDDLNNSLKARSNPKE